MKRVRLIVISVLRVVTPRERVSKIPNAHRVWVDTHNLRRARVSVLHVCPEPFRTDQRAVREVTDITKVVGLRVSVRIVLPVSTVDLTTSISAPSAKLDEHRAMWERVSVRFVVLESTRRVQLLHVRTARSGSTQRVTKMWTAVRVSLLIQESVLRILRSVFQRG